MPINHVSLPTGPSNFGAMRDFYRAALQPLGYRIYKEEDGQYCGLQPPRAGPDFWLHCGGEDFPRLEPGVAAEDQPKGQGRAHVAFSAGSRNEVDNWYRNAIKAGAICNGKPGERAYTKGYYAAYVLDPLGNNIEVVYWSGPWFFSVLNGLPTLLSLLFGAVAGNVALRYARETGW